MAGSNNPFYGKQHSDEVREKISACQKRVMEKLSKLYKQYKQEGGDLSWNSFRHAFANNEINIG